MISIPLAAAPLVMLSSQPALSETATPAEAVALLAKTKYSDAKCRYLSEADHEELSDYVAKGEIAAAEHEGVSAAKSAIAAGRVKGEAALCGPESRAEVEETLRAAREAIVTAQLRSSIAPEAASSGQSRLAGRTKSLGNQSLTAEADRLALYRQQATAYYIERRCGHLSYKEAAGFWQRIVARHKIVLARYGAGAVRAALQKAEAAASARRCDSRTAMLVKESYAAIRR
jgi:hypothetical protein